MKKMDWLFNTPMGLLSFIIVFDALFVVLVLITQLIMAQLLGW